MKTLKNIPGGVVILILLILLYSSYMKNIDDNWKIFSTSSDFYMILAILFYTIIDIIPIKFKNKVSYLWVKKLKTKYFIFNMDYSIEIKNKVENPFKTIEESIKKVDTTKQFIKKDENNFLYDNTLNIEVHYDLESNQTNINFSFKKDNYTIDTLEKDIEYYTSVINIIKEPFIVKDNKISYNITVNKFYTPKYLLKKYYTDEKEFRIKIGDEINYKKDGVKEDITILGNNIDKANENLKNYLSLSL